MIFFKNLLTNLANIGGLAHAISANQPSLLLNQGTNRRPLSVWQPLGNRNFKYIFYPHGYMIHQISAIKNNTNPPNAATNENTNLNLTVHDPILKSTPTLNDLIRSSPNANSRNANFQKTKHMKSGNIRDNGQAKDEIHTTIVRSDTGASNKHIEFTKPPKSFQQRSQKSRHLENTSDQGYRTCSKTNITKYKDDAPRAFSLLFAYWAILSIDPNDFSGTWQIVLDRSDPTNNVTELLGISRIRRRALDSTAVTIVSTITWPNPNVQIPHYATSVYLPLNNVRSFSALADCNPIAYDEPDTGEWTVRTGWFINSFLIASESSKGMLYDRRAVLKEDPKNELSGPLQLQIWTFVPTGNLEPATAVRIMKKI